MSSGGRRYLAVSAGYVLVTTSLVAAGLWVGNRTLEIVGAILLGGTFLPVPLDVYILHLSPDFGPLELGLVVGSLNTVAVLFEWYFLTNLLDRSGGKRVRAVVREASLSHWFRKAPFLTITVAAFSWLPFEIFRFLAVVNDYPLPRYALSTFVGRSVRYVGIVAFGGLLFQHGWLNVVLGVGLVLYLASLFDQEELKAIWHGVEAEAGGAADDP
jgi:membrane protein YqaA with SNARE-associated domain